jgi:hypothetical protein
MNIKFTYLYRDAANYKQYNDLFLQIQTNCKLKKYKA